MRLTKKQLQAVEMLFEGKLTKTEIAKTVNVSRPTLDKWEKKPEFQAELDKMSSELKQRMRRKIDNLANKAIKRQNDILDRGSDTVAATVAKDVLDRAGYAHEQNIKVNADTTVRTNPFDDLTTAELRKMINDG